MGRTTDSPVHSSRASPVVNGALREGKKADTLLDSKSPVGKVKNKGIKRKRESSSSENSPVPFAKLSDDSSSRPCTPLVTGDQQKDDSPGEVASASQVGSPKTTDANVVDSGPITTTSAGDSTSVVNSVEGSNCLALSEGTSQEDSIRFDLPSSDVSTDTRTESQTTAPGLDSRPESWQDDVGMATAAKDAEEQESSVAVIPEKITDTDTTEERSVCLNGAYTSHVDDHCKNSSAVETEENVHSEKAITADMKNTHESCERLEEEEQHSSLPSCEGTSNAASLPSADIEQCDQNPPLLAGGSDMHTPEDKPETQEPVFDLETKAVGINGHYGDDGQWYDWCQVMPIEGGALNILPYVILE